MRVVCVGHVNWDISLFVDRLPEPDGESSVTDRLEGGGGSAANVATGVSALGIDARLAGSVGDDDVGARAISDLQSADVDCRIVTADGVETTRKYVLVDRRGEVAVLGTAGANEALVPEDVDPTLLDDADALHLTGQRPDTAAALAAAADERELPVSFDPGRRLPDRDYGEVLDRADLLFVTDREAAAIDVEVPWCVRKHGDDGATLSCPAGTFSHDGYELASIDSTGAGDAFAAGFLAVWLDSGSPTRALDVANACGALATAVRGPRPELSWEAIDSLVTDDHGAF